jgi:hypothetical protein
VDEPELAAYLKIAIGVLHVRARVSALLTKRLPQTKFFFVFLLDVKPPTTIAASSRQSLGRALDWVVLKRCVCVCVWREGERMREWGSATQLIRPNRAAPGLAGRGWPRPTWLPPPTRHELVEASPRRKEGGVGVWGGQPRSTSRASRLAAYLTRYTRPHLFEMI